MRQPGLVLKSLREQVYEHLRERISEGSLHPGANIDLKSISRELGISTTPLRDALIQLESEGFVSIRARRGVVVNTVTLDEIRHLYEIVGALESAAVMSGRQGLTPAHVRRMRELNGQMRRAVLADDFDTYYERNLAFHDVFLGLSDNQGLRRLLRICKQRLYDFPRRQTWVKQWELASTGEHAAFVDLLKRGRMRAAADYLRDVHWSFSVQERFIHEYYFAGESLLQRKRGEG